MRALNLKAALIITFGLYATSHILQFIFAYANSQSLNEILANTFENWQSEFLQLTVQFVIASYMIDKINQNKTLESINDRLQKLLEKEK